MWADSEETSRNYNRLKGIAEVGSRSWNRTKISGISKNNFGGSITLM